MEEHTHREYSSAILSPSFPHRKYTLRGVVTQFEISGLDFFL
jgi:hypothetical protein